MSYVSASRARVGVALSAPDIVRQHLFRKTANLFLDALGRSLSPEGRGAGLLSRMGGTSAKEICRARKYVAPSVEVAI